MKAVAERDRCMDILRGFAVAYVVMGHSGFPASDFLCQFHTAVFFIVSGYFWKKSYTEDIAGIKRLIWNKIKTLWFPYVIWNGIFMLGNNLLCISGLYLCRQNEIIQIGTGMGEIHRMLSVKDIFIEMIKIGVFMGGTELGGASWFFRILFMVSIAFGIIEFVLRRLSDHYIMAEVIVGIFFSLIGRWCRGVSNVYNGKAAYLLENVGTCLLVYALFVFGQLFFRYANKFNNNRVAMITFVIGITVSVILYGCKLAFFRVPFGITIAVFGWFMIWGQSFLIDKCVEMVAVPMAYLGKNTIPVFMGHFACFKIVNIGIRIWKGLPSYYDGAFPAIDGYWIVYSVTGIVLPLALNCIYKYVRQKIQSIGRVQSGNI